MRALLVFLTFCLLTLAGRWFYVCQIKQLCGKKSGEARLKTLTLEHRDSVFLRDYDQFFFGGSQVIPELNANNRRFLDSVAAHLRTHPDKGLTITGRYRRSEKTIKSGFFENIGVARANAVRKRLMQREIDQDRITLDYGLSPNEQLREPLDFDLYYPSDTNRLARNAFTFTNMTFSDANFEFGSDEFRPGEPFLYYADSVKTYLERHPEKSLTIIGHTDSIDTEAYNYDLGMRRAENAKEYFRELGLTAEIETLSKGEMAPVASNRTPEGRQKNRRVKFILE